MKPIRQAKRAWYYLLPIAVLLLLAVYALGTALQPVTSPPPPTSAGQAAATVQPAGDDATSQPVVPPTFTATATARSARPTATPSAADLHIATPAPADRLPTIPLDRLPPEAHTTLRLIAASGPFPFRQDGTVFQNREGQLPRQPIGYYREYTVVTPGSPDRGARRLVRGNQGELYYTADHYTSFRRVIP